MKSWIDDLPRSGRLPKRLRRRAFGVELELSLLIDGKRARASESMVGPHELITERAPIGWRRPDIVVYPSGNTLSFDGGVIELATPIADVRMADALAVSRALEHDLRQLHQTVEAWGRARGQHATLEPFSTHLSFSDPRWTEESPVPLLRRAKLFAKLVPIVLLCTATSANATTLGLRPRLGGRLEIAFGQPQVFDRNWVTWFIVAELLCGLTDAGICDDASAHAFRLPLPTNLELHPSRTRPGWALRREHLTLDAFGVAPNDPIWRTGDGGWMSSVDLVGSWLDRLDPSEDGQAMLERIRAAIAAARTRSTRAWFEAVPGDVLAWTATEGELGPNAYYAAARAFCSGAAISNDSETWQPVECVDWNRLIVHHERTGEHMEITIDEWSNAHGSAGAEV